MGDEGAVAEQNPGKGERRDDGGMAGQNPGKGERKTFRGMAMRIPARRGRGNVGALAAQNPGRGGRGGNVGYPEVFLFRVAGIRPGLPLFLYHLTTFRLYEVFEATSNGGYNIEPRFCPCFHETSRSSFPAQVRVRWRTAYLPLTVLYTSTIMEHMLRAPLNEYYRYRVELTVPEAAHIMNVFAQHGVPFVR